MKTTTLVIASLIATGFRSLHAQAYQEYFPLRRGNQWTYNTSGSVALPSMRIAARVRNMAFVTGFPGSSEGMWVAFTANTLRAWDPVDRAWEPLFRFSAAVGTTYTVDLPSPALADVEFTIEARGVEHYDAAISQRFADCIRIRVGHRFRWSGLSSFVFAPRVGLVHWVEDSFGVFKQHGLMAAHVDGANVGLIPFTSRERHTDSRYFFLGRHAMLINDSSAWARFYEAHRPGTRPFSVDFSRKTVLVVLVEGQWMRDFAPEVSRVRWDFPTGNVTVFVRGLGPEPAVRRPREVYNPYAIVVLNQKVAGTATLQAE